MKASILCFRAAALLVLADTLLFGWLVFRGIPAELGSARSSVPAE